MNIPRRIIQALKASELYSAIESVYLFGSRVTERASSESDYDIALLCDPKQLPSFDQQMELKNQLEASLGADVDLVLLNIASPVLAMQVVNKGKLILDQHPLRRVSYVAVMMSQYAELKEMRLPIEKNILKRKYYGG